MLQQFGTDLAETELPNDVQCTKDLLITHTEKHDKLKVAIHIYGTVLLILSYDLFNPCCYNCVFFYYLCLWLMSLMFSFSHSGATKHHLYLSWLCLLLHICRFNQYSYATFLLFIQEELKLAVKQGHTLLSCIKDQASKTESHILNPDEVENQTTVERCVKRFCHTQKCYTVNDDDSLSRIIV